MPPNSLILPNVWQGQWRTENECRTFLKYFKISISVTQITQNLAYPASRIYLKNETLFKPAVVTICNVNCHSVIRKYFNSQDKTVPEKTLNYTELHMQHENWSVMQQQDHLRMNVKLLLALTQCCSGFH